MEEFEVSQEVETSSPEPVSAPEEAAAPTEPEVVNSLDAIKAKSAEMEEGASEEIIKEEVKVDAKPAYTPDFKVTAYGKEHEIPEMFRRKKYGAIIVYFCFTIRRKTYHHSYPCAYYFIVLAYDQKNGRSRSFNKSFYCRIYIIFYMLGAVLFSQRLWALHILYI